MLDNYTACIIHYKLENHSISTSILSEIHSKQVELLNSLGIENIVNINGNTVDEIFQQLANNNIKENIIVIHYNMPCLFASIVKQTIQQHSQFNVDYTFTEYFPWGVSPFIIKKNILSSIYESIDNKSGVYHHKVIENILHNNLNQYDIEIVLADDDYRFIKEDFIIIDKRSNTLFEKILKYSLPLDSFPDFIATYISFFRASPNFIDISLTANKSAVFQAPYKEKVDLDLKYLNSFLEQIFLQNPSASVQFNLRYGDPLQYSNINELIDLLHQFKEYSFIIETFASDKKLIEELLSKFQNIKIIIYITAVSQKITDLVIENYQIRDREKIIESLLNQFPNRVYLQWVRMILNEEELPIFLERWNIYQQNIIISQYDNISTTLPDYKVVDFTPLKRFPCFHLAHDLFIHPNGAITPCSSDITHSLTSASLTSIDLDKIQDEIASIYKDHFNSILPDICKKCDIWYIFNL